MKRILLLSLLSLLLGLSVVPGAFAAGVRTVTLLYTGAAQGNIAPCAV